jgi:hypothetical protein
VSIVYFAHSYRDYDADLNEYFLQLIQDEGFLPSLDPPSDIVNAAKLERHLRCVDAMIAILNRRPDGISPYILFEMSLCIRAGKPLLVFVEDILAENLIPIRILQQRFSRRSRIRQIREQRHALRILKHYLGDEPPPRYQSSLSGRSCLIVGAKSLPKLSRESLLQTISDKGYRASGMQGDFNTLFRDALLHEQIAMSDVALCFADAQSPSDHYLMGAVQFAFVPTITLATEASYNFISEIPTNFQPRLVSPYDIAGMGKVLDQEFEIFEQDFLDLTDRSKADRYTAQLFRMSSNAGHYGRGTRQGIVEVVVGDRIGGDKISVGNIEHSQGTAVGRGAQANVTQGVSDTTLAQLFSSVYQQIAARPEHPDVDKVELTETVQKIQNEVAKGEQANPNRVGRWLKSLADAAPDILDVAVACLTSPAAGVAAAIRKVTEKVSADTTQAKQS